MTDDADRHDRGEAGFTLVELLIVVLIIGILVAVALPSFLGARRAASDRAAQSELRTALGAALTHFSEAGRWDAFDDTEAESVEPTLEWTPGGSPTTAQISIHVHSGPDLLLVARSSSGTFFCVAQILGSPATDRGSGMVFGDVDTVAECVGGW